MKNLIIFFYTRFNNMNKENLPSLNLKFNFPNKYSGEVPFINISDSMSKSSKNQNSKTSSNNKISLTQNNNSSSNSRKNQQNSSFNLIRKKIFGNGNQNKSSSEIIIFKDNSLNDQLFDTSLNLNNHSNFSISEDKKEIKTEKDYVNPEFKTPKKSSNNNVANFSNYKYKDKAIQKIDNINGKNLMVFYQYMHVEDVTTEEKNNNRNPSVDNITSNTFKLNSKTNTNINKSWNKKNNKISNFKNQPIKIINNDNKSSSINKKIFKKKLKKKRAIVI